ncbi:MAG: PAS domain S-box protein [Deltaproteobacteria bacterium]|nr:PAS domain S-box protein [Deltaproteobacteria bacterium]
MMDERTCEQLNQKVRDLEEALRESEEKYRVIIEGIEDGYYEVDLAGNLTFFSDSICNIWGYAHEELMGMNYRKFTVEKDAEAVYRTFNGVYTTGRPTKAYAWEIIRKDGEAREVELSVSLTRDPEGKPVGFRGIARDVTERKRAEDELRRHRHHLEEMVTDRTAELQKTNEQLKREIAERKQVEESLLAEKHFSESVINSLPGAFYVFDENGRFLKWNKNFEEVTGYGAGDLSTMSSLDFFEGEDRQRVAGRIREVFVRGSAFVEAHMRSKDGKKTPFVFSGVRIRLDGNTYLVGMGMDITQRKRAEEALRESEKELRILSTQLLTAQENERRRVAQELHDGIGQALTAIKFSMENTLANMQKTASSPNIELLKSLIPVIQRAIDEGRRISMDLRPSTLDDLGILATIAWFCREFQRIYSGISIEREIRLEEGDVPEALKTVIYRVLQEALNNAAKHSRASRVRLYLGMEKDTIDLVIEDNGTGFDLESVMTSDSRTRGFGLASMRERTELSGGSFSIETGAPEGTVIRAAWPGV